MRLAGIDGCPTGWVAVVAEAGNLASARLAHVLDLRAFLASVDFALVDMPIGLVTGPESRDVEGAVRLRLKGKASSVFPTPCRDALAQFAYPDASGLNEKALSKRLPKQTFMLFPKMREVDQLARDFGQSRLREGHPEASFAEMAGRPVLSKKRVLDGRIERVRLLEGQGLPAPALLGDLVRGAMAPDDILDAAALLWSAERFQRGQHVTFPPVPSRDAVGLEMSVIA